MLCAECGIHQESWLPWYVENGNPKYYKPIKEGFIIFCSPQCATAYNQKLRIQNENRERS